MYTDNPIFDRARLLMGDDVMQTIASRRVIIFGVGGVGSWVAECLIRSGIRHLTIVDSDRICASNVNRQLMATSLTVGEVKVDALRRHLLEISPDADILALQKIYSADTADDFALDTYDYIIDAIDSLKDKALLMLRACETRATLFSSMGAALKMDPTLIRVAEFWKVRGCPLGAALRKKFKHMHCRPARKFMCVYGEQVLDNRGAHQVAANAMPVTQEPAPGDPTLAHHDWNASKAQINGSMVHITAIFGFTIGGLVLNDIYTQYKGRVTIFQVGLDQTLGAWRDAAKNIPWIAVYDPAGEASKYVQQYQVYSIPTSFIIDKNGEIQERIQDPLELKKAIQKYL